MTRIYKMKPNIRTKGRNTIALKTGVRYKRWIVYLICVTLAPRQQQHNGESAPAAWMQAPPTNALTTHSSRMRDKPKAKVLTSNKKSICYVELHFYS